MRLTWVFIGVVFASFLLDQSEGHWTKFKTRIFPSKRFRGGGFLCRLRRHRTVVDEYNNYVKCVRRCPSNGYTEMYSVTRGRYCKPIVIPSGCLDEYCNMCQPSFKWIHSFTFKTRCVKTCPEQYYETQNECQRCFSSDCKKCSDSWTCTECERGFALYKGFMGSTICLRRCLRGYKKQMVSGKMRCVRPSKAISTTTTTEEPMTTTEEKKTTTEINTENPTTTTTTTTPTPTTVQPPPEGCDDLYCTTCSESYLKLVTSSMRKSACVKQCPVGYSASGSICIACADSRCGLCEASITECTKCKAGFSLMLDATNISTECVRYCPKDYVKENVNGASTCMKEKEKECPVTNCQECLDVSLFPINRGCAQCRTGFKLFRGALNDHCYTSCPPGYYVITEKETNSSICARCEVLFCKSCSQPDTCDACVEPMVLDSTTGKCRFCKKYTVFVSDLKKCVPINVNKPEAGNEIGVFGGPFLG